MAEPKSIHTTIRGEVLLVEDAGGDPDVTTNAILAALDEQGFEIVSTDRLDRVVDTDDSLVQALRECHAMLNAVLDLVETGTSTTVRKNEVRAVMRAALERASRNDIGRHDDLAGRL